MVNAACDTSPVVTFNDDKAIAETNAIVVAEDAVLGVGCEGNARLLVFRERNLF